MQTTVLAHADCPPGISSRLDSRRRQNFMNYRSLYIPKEFKSGERELNQLRHTYTPLLILLGQS